MLLHHLLVNGRITGPGQPGKKHTGQQEKRS